MDSSMEEGEKPSWIREGMSGAYSCHKPRRLASTSIRRAVSRERNCGGRGEEGGGLKG